MPIPPFDEHGLLPRGVWDCTLDEIAATLCMTDRRRLIFSGLTNFLAHEWRPIGISCPVFVDGSFVRSKLEPSDVDIVFDVSSVTDNAVLSQVVVILLRRAELKAAYTVDVWARHPGIANDLSAFFQYLGDKAGAELQLDRRHPKGILRIQP